MHLAGRQERLGGPAAHLAAQPSKLYPIKRGSIPALDGALQLDQRPAALAVFGLEQDGHNITHGAKLGRPTICSYRAGLYLKPITHEVASHAASLLPTWHFILRRVTDVS